MTTESISARRTVNAPADRIFAILADPARHQDIEPTDWVRDAVDSQPLTAVGDVFAMNMFHVGQGGDYRMHNKVTVFDRDSAIAWEPGQASKSGTVNYGGWEWRYDLKPTDEGTDVTLNYDWSGASKEVRAVVPFPAVNEDYLGKSLAGLAALAE
ncbi:SRPBCC family protein [Antricoccus suffuscus]|nr:SRPBCC family protein [Antricoccus suffuscus]